MRYMASMMIMILMMMATRTILKRRKLVNASVMMKGEQCESQEYGKL